MKIVIIPLSLSPTVPPILLKKRGNKKTSKSYRDQERWIEGKNMLKAMIIC